jgi:hypothetical protein
MTLKDKILAVLRSGAAMVVGSALTWAAVHWHVLLSPGDNAAVIDAVSVLVSVGYLAGCSWLQRQWPAWAKRWPVLARAEWLVGLLLLSSHQPLYVPARLAGKESPSARLARHGVR